MHSSRVVHLPPYSITDHEEDADHGFHYSPKTIDLLVAGEKLVRSKKPNALVKLRKLVADYPNVPAFKNYLVTYYLVHNKFDEGYALNRQVVNDYPDYLFGKLNLAGEYLFKREYAQIPKILGEKLDIKDLYPHRKVFYSNEVLSFFNVVCRYLIEVGRLDEAEQRIEAAAEIFRENQVVADVQAFLTETRTDHFYQKLNALLEERGEDSLGESYDTTLRTSELPVFTHPEIWALYENDLRIDQAVLKKILALPRKSLLKDLETVLWDSVRRFEYFSALAEETDVWADGKLSFPLHALFLMSELKATEELPFILDYFKQGGQVLDFWYEDHTTETLWHILYHLGANQLDLLQEFMQAPCIYYSSRWIVLSAINQLALHHPERRQEFMGWYGSLLDFFLSNLDDPKVIDPKVNGSLVAELLDIQAKELLPGLKILFDRGLVDWFAVGDYNAVKKEMMFSSYSDWSKHPVFKSVFAHYDHIINTWYAYAPKEEYEKKQEQIRKTWSEKHLEQGALKPPKNNLPDSLRSIPIASKTAKVGRNEPCPCGSGKKYKHCCGKN